MDGLQERKARSVYGGLQQARHIKRRKALELFAEYVLGAYYSGVGKHGNHIEASKDSFEKRWHKAREILLTSK